ncbi:peptidase M24 family protein [Gordonia hirsuta DSM 44140 = NBRC 16056]|uniref:Peptidase M24 family protein n=1 Tax=Gordonia hirsuta DSM 44140 = NBRC 16056 TaxID=1121927 RepID=L7LB93_9ACTN|nr:Xaa-Pro peptidase family protein [Gordonia hirsuta]GAC57337.1 peptidase M24 family protein [Gordonia hirsuta DSM 44140 = NBRC 16056]
MPVTAEVRDSSIDRRRRLSAALAAHDVDLLLVTDLTNVRYLTGFTGSNAAVAVPTDLDGTTSIATDGRYRDQVTAQAPGLPVVIERNAAAGLLTHLTQEAPGGRLRVGFESDAVTVAAYTGLCEVVAGTDLELVALRGVVQELRECKEPGEIALIEKACQIADNALAALIESDAVVAGRSELAVARDLEWAMYDHGAAGIAFETIVAAGPNSAVPHHRPTSALLAEGDLVKMDFGAVVQGYHSDMTRTVILGEAASWQREIYEVVAQAQAAGRAALVPGAALVEVDAAAREVIAAAGYGPQYVHGLGHGVGLQIHEAPGIGATATGTLRAGATVTVEPGIYLPGRGGVRIEDTLVVTDTGARSLTSSPRALQIL